MIAEKRQYRVLVVSSSDKVCEHLYRLLPPSEFSPILRVKTAGEARRQLFSGAVDILIINTPLTDDFGVQLALDLSDDSMVIGTSAIVATESDGAVGMNSGIFNNPFIIWGKYRKRSFRYELPISFQFHHTQMDGAHAGQFLENLQNEIKRLQ